MHTRGKVDDPTVLNVAREIVDLTRKVILLKEKEVYPLRMIGLEVDAAVLVVLAWLGRDADCFFRGDAALEDEEEEESFKLEAEDERRVRLHLFDFTVSALEVAKQQSFKTTTSVKETQSPIDNEGEMKGDGEVVPGSKSSLTGHACPSTDSTERFGQGSFRVKLGPQGMDFTLIPDGKSETKVEREVSAWPIESGVNSQNGAVKGWWARWFI